MIFKPFRAHTRKQTHTTEEGSTLGYADIIPTLRKSGFNAIGFNEKSLLDSETKGTVDQYIGIISIGITTGEMYTSTQHVLQAMDLNKYQSKCLMQALHKHACATSERTIKSRRALEFGSAPQAGGNAANPVQPGAADPG